jgi:adenylate cyclase
MADRKFHRRLSAILAADVAGYTRLVEQDTDGIIAAWQNARDDVIKPVMAEFMGKIINWTGDGFLAEFQSIQDAVNCAIAMQSGLSSNRLSFRMGINLGDVVDDGEDILGEGVNVAARLEGLAKPGGIVISGDVYNQVRNRVDVTYVDMGIQNVKNVSTPIRAYYLSNRSGSVGSTKPAWIPTADWLKTIVATAVILSIVVTGGFVWWRNVSPDGMRNFNKPTSTIISQKPSIAVLPFNNMSEDRKQDYFSDGITEDLITDLSKISGIIVIARTSTFVYRGKKQDIRKIASELGVRYVLEGSVRKVGDKVRINAQLIDAQTGGHIWAERYDGKLEDIFGLQDKVTSNIVATLAIKLTTSEQTRIGQVETKNIEAYDLFLRGWEQYQLQRPESMRKAIDLFGKATLLDPSYSRAYAALSASYWQIWKRFWGREMGMNTLHEPLSIAEELVVKSMKEPTSLALQVSVAMLAQQGRHKEAITEGERAIALDPNDADSYVALAGAFNLAGRSKEALTLMKQAIRLNPFYPASYLYELGLAHFTSGDFEQAAIAFEKAVAINPKDKWSSRVLIATLGHLKRKKYAIQMIVDAEQNWRGLDPLSVRGVTYWYPFKEVVDAERLADGLRKAGVPE